MAEPALRVDVAESLVEMSAATADMLAAYHDGIIRADRAAEACRTFAGLLDQAAGRRVLPLEPHAARLLCEWRLLYGTTDSVEINDAVADVIVRAYQLVGTVRAGQLVDEAFEED